MSSGDGAGGHDRSPDRADLPVAPREREIVELLREVGRGTAGPDAATSDRMRARLMAAVAVEQDAPVGSDPSDPLDPSGGPAGPTTEDRGPSTAPRTGRRRAVARSRPGRGPGGRREGARGPVGRRARLIARVSGALSVVLLAGVVLVVLGRDALPGDALYGVKRASESAELALPAGQEARARRHLGFAEERLSEVSGLLGRASGPGTVPTSGVTAAGSSSELVADTLADFESETSEGVRLFLPLTTAPSGPSPTLLAGWARVQSGRLDALAPSVLGASRPALDSSRALLGRVVMRADGLAAPAADCPRTGTDEWGPVTSCDATGGAAAPAPGAGTPVPVPAAPSTVGETTTETSTRDATTPAAPRTPVGVPAFPVPTVPSVPVPRIPVPTVDVPAVPVPTVPGLPSVAVPPGIPGLGGG